MIDNNQEKLSFEYNNFGEDIQVKRIQSKYLVRSKVHTLMYKSVVECVKPASSIVDLGCGDGGLTFLLTSKTSNVVGMDISEFNINLAQERYSDKKGITFEIGDVCGSRFKNNEFEVSVSHHVLEHLSDFSEGLIELKRITNKTIYICLPTANSPISWTLLGGGNYWKHGKLGTVRLLKGLARTAVGFLQGKIGIDEGSYSSLENVPHIFFFPKRISKIMNCSEWQVVNHQPQVTGLPWIARSIKIGRKKSVGGLGTIFTLERISN